MFPNGDSQSRRMYPRESSSADPAARNVLQFGHGPAQRSQSARTFPLDESLQRLTDQCCFLSYSGELLGDAYQIVIQREGRSHWDLQALIIASSDVYFCAE